MIPTPEERPDLYDDYDGLPEGRASDVKLENSPAMEARIKAYAAERAAREGKKDSPKAE